MKPEDGDQKSDAARIDSVNAAVIEKLKSRAVLGRNKYGVTMDRKDLSEKEWLIHLQQELLDGAVYAEKKIQECSRKCIWKRWESGQFETSCDNVFEFTVDGIRENGFKFCPWCGGAIEEKAEEVLTAD